MNWRRRASLGVLALAVCAVAGESSPPTRTPTSAAPLRRKFALLVGIDRYQAVNGLEGCVNDVERMRALLVGRFGFPEKEVLVLTNGQATNAGIRQAFRRHLIDQAGPNDIALFHFSGHGSRMIDASGDEIDGWDETIVPVDSRKPGIFDIPDDDLNEMLTALGRKTPYVTFILDSCHSGSATRGGARIRRIPDDPRTPPGRSAEAAAARPGTPVGFNSSTQSYVLIAGCGPKELSNEYEAEGRSYGALSYFLTTALSRAGSDATYRDVMDRVRGEVEAVYPSQHPQLEGPRQDTQIFGIEDRLTESYLLVSPLGGSRVEVKGGLAHGLTPQAVLEVYPPGTKTFEAGAAGASRVELTLAEAFRSEGKVVAGGPVAARSRAVLRERRYPDDRFRVNLDGASDAALAAEIRQRLEKHPDIEVVSGPTPARMSVSRTQGAIRCLGGDLSTSSPPVAASDPNSGKKIADQLAHWAKWYTVFSLTNATPELEIRLEVSAPPAGVAFADGDRLRVTVTNLSRRDVYVSIVDLSSDGSVEPVYPPSGVEEPLPPNRSLAQSIQLFVPEGRDSVTDVIRAVVATEYINPAVFRIERFRGEGLGRLGRLVNGMTARGGAAIQTGSWITAQKSVTIRRGPTMPVPTPSATPHP